MASAEKSMKVIRGVLLAAAAALAAIQFVPVSRTNPPVTGDLPAPPEIKALLRAACYDCHSHETAWPWYARVAPVSWLVGHDVKEGRKHLNFSTWDQYTEPRRGAMRLMAAEEAEEREMPPYYYAWAHPGARLSDEQVKLLAAWFEPPAMENKP